jgi:reactive intermediate/imine deaminase
MTAGLAFACLSCEATPRPAGDTSAPEPALEASGLPTAAPEFLSSSATESLSLPFAEAVRYGGMLYLSGQVGSPPGTLELVPGGIGPETRQTMENIKSILERNGSSLDRVVKCTVYLVDMSEWPALNEIYVTYFPGRPPARAAAGASALALGARVEIECMAAVGS